MGSPLPPGATVPIEEKEMTLIFPTRRRSSPEGSPDGNPCPTWETRVGREEESRVSIAIQQKGVSETRTHRNRFLREEK